MTTPITKERLIKIKEWRELYGAGSNVVLPAEEAEELARIALAAMGAEPIAWTDEQELRDMERGGCGYLFTCNPVTPHADERRVIKLYDAPPAPVSVPDEMEPTVEAIKRVLPTSNPDEYAACIGADMWNACRAAMLQSFGNFEQLEPVTTTCKLPRNSFTDAELEMMSHGDNPQANAYRELLAFRRNYPVIPDGWVKCSERMPKDAQWCAVNTKYGYYVQCWSEGQGWLGDEISIPDCDVTHWMPLPAAPQQEGDSE